MRVDPELLPGLEVIPPFVLSEPMLPEMRAIEALNLPAPVLPCAVSREARVIAGAPGDPDVRILVYLPAARTVPSAAFLHIHGGGFVAGSPEMSDPANRLLAAQLGCVVVSVDYRLAPETRYPGPVEDCYAGLAWLHEQAAALGIDPSRIAIGGESAGGGHAAVLALLARDRGRYPIVHQHLIYPMIDDRTGTDAAPAPVPGTGEHIWTAEANRFGWRALLGVEPGTDAVAVAAVPARRTDLGGLPPAFIGTAALDLFVGENIDYARRLIACGVATELLVAPGAYHGFDQFVPDAAVSRRFAAASRAALAHALNGS